MEENAQKLWKKIKLNSDYHPTVSDNIEVFNKNTCDKITEEGRKLIKEMDEYCVECGLGKISKNTEMLCDDTISDKINEDGMKTSRYLIYDCGFYPTIAKPYNFIPIIDYNPKFSDEITEDGKKTLKNLIDNGFAIKPKIQPTALNFNRDDVTSLIYTLFKYPTFNLNTTEEGKKIMKKLKRVMFHHDIKEIYNEFDAKNKSCKKYGGSRNNGKNAMAVEILRLRNKIKKLENDSKA